MIYGGFGLGRVFGGDKNYLSFEKGFRDFRKDSWVVVSISLRRGVFVYNRFFVINFFFFGIFG